MSAIAHTSVQNVSCQMPLAQNNVIAEGIKKLSLLIGKIRLRIAQLRRVSEKAGREIFGEKVIAVTQNTAKQEDVKTIVCRQYNPQMFAHYKRQVLKNGYVFPEKGYHFEAIDEGKCFGGVMHFMSLASMYGSAEIAAKKFEGGMPLTALHYQGFYNNMQRAKTPDIGVATDLYALLHFPKSTDSQEFRENLQERISRLADADSLTEIYELVLEMTKRGEDPNEVDFVDRTINHFIEKGMPLESGALGTIMEIGEQEGVSKKQLLYSILGFTQVAQFTAKHPATLLDNLEHLTKNDGFYHLDTPFYNQSEGRWGRHAVGMIIEKGQSYLLDPNHSIARFDQSELKHYATKALSNIVGEDLSSPNVDQKMPLSDNPIAGYIQLHQYTSSISV